MAKKPVVLEVPGEVTLPATEPMDNNDLASENETTVTESLVNNDLASENETLRKELEALKAAQATTVISSSSVKSQTTAKPVLTKSGWVV